MVSFINEIRQSGFNEIFWIFIGFIISKVLDNISSRFEDKRKRAKVTKRIAKSDNDSYEKCNIVGLSHAYPYYKEKNMILLSGSKKLFFSIPSDIKEKILQLNPEFEFNEDLSFNGKNSFEELINITGIENLDDMINRYKNVVAEEFLKKIRESIELFNGRKFGIYNLLLDKDGSEEDSRFRIELFETDYFTHMVFREIYRELVRVGHPIKDVTKSNELMKYRPFLTSFGINTYVVLDNGDMDGKTIVFAKRSKYVGHGSNASKWHVSINEGLTYTDIDDNRVNLYKCLQRGLNEELGINDIENRNKDIKFMDLFLEKDKFEIGITSFIELQMTFEELKTLYMSAKDGDFETDEIVKVNYNRKEINRFIYNNSLTNAGWYTLKMYTNRHK